MSARSRSTAERLAPEALTPPALIKTFALTTVAMIAFAANSLLCRAALTEPVIDPASFTAIRLVSGAIALWLLVRWRRKAAAGRPADWPAAAMLFLYAAAFSFAYLSLSAGTGALILFGSVQFTMLTVGLWAGERLSLAAWVGVALALGGLVLLVAPGVTAPAPLAAGLMALAGVAWGVYSLRGRGAREPLQETAANFVRAAPLGLLLLLGLVWFTKPQLSGEGVGLALLSGALASGGGYAIWYTALRGLTASAAATVQLSVPVITALGGVLFLSEGLTLRLLLASIAILGGIAMVVRLR